MDPLAITGMTCVSAVGVGMTAIADALRADCSGCRPCDYEDATLETYIGRVDGVEDYPLDRELVLYECRNNRLANMAIIADDFETTVTRAVERYGRSRVGLVLGTSTSGVREGEYAFANRDPITGSLPETFHFAQTQSYHSLAKFVQARLGLAGPALTVSTACSSSAKAFADAAQLIDAGFCDAVVIGGADSLCLLTLYGFGSLQLLATDLCQPNDANRAGISIGEGSGFALLERPSAHVAAMATLAGYGESADAHHISAPHPEGVGSELSMRAALQSANLKAEDIDYLNQHGTGTRQNDKSEEVAITRVFGEAMRCSSTKGATGHTLGAAGIIEAAICVVALSEGLIPGNTNLTELDPEFRCHVVAETQPGAIRYALSNSFGFGGNNCSLIFGQGQ